MGLKSSKLVINPSESVVASAGDEVQGTVKEVNENGCTEVAAEINDEAPKTDEPAVDESKCSASKKKNPINWIQKKISFKKLRTPRKQPIAPESVEVAPTEAVATEEEASTNCAMTQSVEVVKVDQGAGHGDPISSEPIVEIAPTANGIVNHGDEHYEEVAPPFVEEVPAIVEEDKAQPEVNDLELSEKLANLGMNHSAATHNGLENGHGDNEEN